MKQITKTREEKIIINETKYLANDGTMFNDEQDCLTYEKKLYLNELKNKYSKIPKKAVIENDFLYLGGCEDYLLNIVEVRNDEDIDTMLELCLYFNEWYGNKEIEKVKETLEKSKGSKIIIGIGYCYNDINTIDEEVFQIFYPIDELVEHIKSFI